MLIYIKSGEAGWEVERKIELPDDEKLVRSILRSGKRRLDPPKAAGGGVLRKRPSRHRLPPHRKPKNQRRRRGTEGSCW